MPRLQPSRFKETLRRIKRWFRREPEVHWIAAFGDEFETLREAAELIQAGLIARTAL